MKKLLSLPPHLVHVFHQLTGLDESEYFCTNDPVNHRLGSGGGTVWLLDQCHRATAGTLAFGEWLAQEKRILIHAGGHSRRLPAYAPSGKVLTPIPVCRWERGQRLNQTLLDLQLPLYEQLMQTAPDSLHTLVVSGDVYVRTNGKLPVLPEADVVCVGIWLNAEVAKNHGVYMLDRHCPEVLKYMVQKPSVEYLKQASQEHLFLTDVGIWFLNDKAVEVLKRKSLNPDGTYGEYDLYGQFGCSLGTHPQIADDEVNGLSVAIVPLDGGEFYHFGTSSEMISSTLAIQNVMSDQRRIMHIDRKPHPSIFVQNSITDIPFCSANQNIWIENSHISHGWQITETHVLTGIPRNDWQVALSPGQCVDIVPVDVHLFALRVYRMDERFDGDEQQKKRFPVVEFGYLEEVLKAQLKDQAPNALHVVRLMSADDLSNEANLQRLFSQRASYQKENCVQLAKNWRHSVFYQLDLQDMAGLYKKFGLSFPDPLPASAPMIHRIHDAMFRGDGDSATTLLKEAVLQPFQSKRQTPRLTAQPDQIVWSRSPVRIDIAGGWTDTPPYSMLEGGAVVNLAINLNGRPPLQVYVRPCKERHIILRSIDLGAEETITSYSQIEQFTQVGSPFSIPKAAFYLSGFHPDTCSDSFPSLQQQLDAFGSGVELTMFSAIPSGSGLGTSSILAATVLGALNDFCGLEWDKLEICQRTFALEQLLTTGGGWQDQFGGVMGGVKLLQTTDGFVQRPSVKWLPDHVFTSPAYAQCHLLYYTGMRRTAKGILAEIVRRMFLNDHDQLHLLRRMKDHALSMYEALQQQDYERVGILMRHTWMQNQAIDSGTNPAEVEAITRQIDDLCLGYKLPGAGGGGYLYMMAKDPDAAVRIKQILNTKRPNENARFVDMTLSLNGLEITRS